eukprot:2727825-Heterocapsa_arctica.AAC.1
MPNGHAEPADGYRPAITNVTQLKLLIELGLTSAHGKPMNMSYFDHVNKVHHLAWKWGTWSIWGPCEDVNVLLIRYAQLCLNEDMEL